MTVGSCFHSWMIGTEVGMYTKHKVGINNPTSIGMNVGFLTLSVT